MQNVKKCLSLLLALLLVVGFSAVSARAEETRSLTREDVLAMDKSELLLTLMDHGLMLPEDYAAHIEEMAEGFVYEYTPMIMEGSIDASIRMFNYDQSNELLSSLSAVLYDLGLAASSTISARSAYTLQNSTPIGLWSESYTGYNCYAYALGKTGDNYLQPGQQSGEYFSMAMPISDMADVVLKDLAKEGYWGYKTDTKPTSLPDEYFRVIAIRKDDTDNKDFHFMKFSQGSLNVWDHKPGPSQPLKWNYSSPEATIWSNEAIMRGITYAPTITYDSDVYYILYKHESDPGIQLQSLAPETD